MPDQEWKAAYHSCRQILLASNHDQLPKEAQKTTGLFLALLKKTSSNPQRYARKALTSFASVFPFISNTTRNNLWQVISKVLLHDRPSLPFTEEALHIFASAFSGIHSWECLRLRFTIEQGGDDKIKHELARFPEERRLRMLLYLSRWLYENRRYTLALHLGEEAYALAPENTMVLRCMANILYQMGDITRRLSLLKQLKERGGTIYGQEIEIAVDEARMLSDAWEWNAPAVQLAQGEAIIHVLNKSFPEINGYTVRSMDIVKHQLGLGLHPVVVTRMGWPPQTAGTLLTWESYENIDHVHLYDQLLLLNKVPMSDYFQGYADRFASLLERIKPRIIHAASNFQNALPPLTVAKQSGVPSVYEVRGLWHYTAVAKRPGFEGSERFQLHEQYELICCNLANRVVVISECLKEYLVKQGVEEAKICVVPNGVDIRFFRPRLPHALLRRKYGLIGKTVIGYIGSLEFYEGLEYLLQAAARLQNERNDLVMLIVGDGPALPGLRQLAKMLKVDGWVNFVGKIPREEILDYYSVIDVFPFPRIQSKVCELVTPLKPFEAMAMGKLILVSDTPALREMVIDGRTGLVFLPENTEALLDCLRKILSCRHLGEEARRWVVENRNWSNLISRYRDIYEMER